MDIYRQGYKWIPFNEVNMSQEDIAKPTLKFHFDTDDIYNQPKLSGKT